MSLETPQAATPIKVKLLIPSVKNSERISDDKAELLTKEQQEEVQSLQPNENASSSSLFMDMMRQERSYDSLHQYLKFVFQAASKLYGDKNVELIQQEDSTNNNNTSTIGVVIGDGEKEEIGVEFSNTNEEDYGERPVAVRCTKRRRTEDSFAEPVTADEESKTTDKPEEANTIAEDKDTPAPPASEEQQQQPEQPEESKQEQKEELKSKEEQEQKEESKEEQKLPEQSQEEQGPTEEEQEQEQPTVTQLLQQKIKLQEDTVHLQEEQVELLKEKLKLHELKAQLQKEIRELERPANTAETPQQLKSKLTEQERELKEQETILKEQGERIQRLQQQMQAKKQATEDVQTIAV